MKYWLMLLILTAGTLTADSSVAQERHHPGPTVYPRAPVYWTIRPQTPQQPRRTSYTQGYVVPRSRSGYAYGWFGATPRRHYSRHFGYFRGYTQWTSR